MRALSSPFVFAKEWGVELSRDGIIDSGILQHRDAAINLIDGVIDFNGDVQTMTAIKLLRVNDPVFNGHFPGNPICPGHFVLEMCQLSAALFYFCLKGEIQGLPLPRSVDRVVWRDLVRPNDILFIKISNPKMERRFFTCSAAVEDHRNKRKMTIGEIRGLLS